MTGARADRLSVSVADFEQVQQGIVTAGEGAAAVQQLVDGDEGPKTSADAGRSFVVAHLCADLEALRVRINRMAMGASS